MAIYSNGQVGWFSGTPYTPPASTLWTNIYAVYNADSTGSSSLKTSLYAAYNGESNANDSFGSNNGTAVGGLTYTTGKIGNAFNLNGTNAYVSLPNNTLNFTGDFSYSVWVNLTSTTGIQPIINNFMDNGVDYRGNTLFIFNNSLYFRICNSTSTPIDLTTSFTTLNTWVNIVVTRKSSTRTRIYINGNLAVSNTNTVNPTYFGNMLYNTLGSYYDSNGWRYLANNSKIDAVNIWQKELTQSEITELYNSGNGSQYITDNFYKPTPNDALNTYNGTAQGGLTYGVGKVGTAFVFNGSNSVVSLPTNSMKFTGDFSYSFWVNFASLGGYPTLISNYRNAGGDYGYFIRMNPSNKLEVYGLATSTTSFSLASVTTFNTNTWYHISVTKSASSVKIYVNGVLERTTSVGVPMTYFSTMYPAIGALYNWNGSSSTDFVSNGSKIDAVGIWNKELTQSEITELYNSGNGKQYPN